jgi:hypothetical protein
VWARHVCVVGVVGALWGFIGCTFTVDTAPLTNGQCPQKQKGCSINGVVKCVDATKPDYGCNAPPTDTHQCFSCGTLGFAHGVPTCNPASGLCDIASCDPGYVACPGQDRTQGCQTFINGDNNNCGTCGNKCVAVGHETANTCQSGKCTATCEAGWMNCALGSVCDCGPAPTKTCVNRVCM